MLSEHCTHELGVNGKVKEYLSLLIFVKVVNGSQQLGEGTTDEVESKLRALNGGMSGFDFPMDNSKRFLSQGRTCPGHSLGDENWPLQQYGFRGEEWGARWDQTVADKEIKWKK